MTIFFNDLFSEHILQFHNSKIPNSLYIKIVCQKNYAILNAFTVKSTLEVWQHSH